MTSALILKYFSIFSHVPTVLWAQREDKVFLTVAVEEIEKPDIKLEENSLSFVGTAKNGQKYELNIEFFKEVDTKVTLD